MKEMMQEFQEAIRNRRCRDECCYSDICENIGNLKCKPKTIEKETEKLYPEDGDKEGREKR